MAPGQIIFYDYDHCREFLEQRADDLRATAQGLDTLAICRELFYSFSYEALEQSALTLAQLDSGMVYLFVPAGLSPREYPQGHEVARAKALELLDCKEPPIVLELLASQALEPPVGERGTIGSWMRQEFLDDVLLAKRVKIQLYFDGGGFFAEVIRAQLEQSGLVLMDDYLKAAKSGVLRVKHPAMPGKIFKLPWLLWVREMMGGGYSVVYLMACFATYLQKLNSATTVAS